MSPHDLTMRAPHARSHQLRVSTLREIADIASGVTKGRRLLGETILVPYLRVANVQAGRLALDEVKEIAILAGELERFRLQAGDILMTEGGDPDKLGRGAIWTGVIDPCVHQNHVFRVRLNRELSEPRYFARYLASGPAVQYFLRAAKQTTGIATINKTQLGALPVPLPPLEVQRRIADILDKADAIRRKRKEAIALTEELLRSAFLEMFGDPVTNPKGWEVKSLKELAEITTGNTPSRARPEFYGSGIEWIKSDNINTPQHVLTESSERLSDLGRKSARKVSSGATLITCIAGSPSCIGNVGLADREVAFNQQINAASPRYGIDYRFLYTMLLIGKPLVQAASTNSMKGLVSKGKLERIQVLAPSGDLQRAFGEHFDRMLGLLDRLALGLGESERCFNALLSAAMSAPSTSSSHTLRKIHDQSART